MYSKFYKVHAVFCDFFCGTALKEEPYKKIFNNLSKNIIYHKTLYKYIFNNVVINLITTPRNIHPGVQAASPI